MTQCKEKRKIKDATTPDGTPLRDQYGSLGVTFSSEDEPSIWQTTDPEDASGRFDAPFRVLAEQGLDDFLVAYPVACDRGRPRPLPHRRL